MFAVLVEVPLLLDRQAVDPTAVQRAGGERARRVVDMGTVQPGLDPVTVVVQLHGMHVHPAIAGALSSIRTDSQSLWVAYPRSLSV